MKLTKMLLAVILVGAAVFETCAGESMPAYPGTEWTTKSPGQAGLNAEKLKELSDYAGGFGCLVRHGYMVYTWGDAGRRKDVASAAKPLYAHFLFKAVEDGRIFSFDERLSKWQPRLNLINKNLGYKDSNISWRHCANQISCYGLAEAPGAAFAYNDWQMSLFWDTLFQKVYGANFETVDTKVFHPMLTDKLQCQDNPTFMAFGTGDRPGRLAISPRDFARFGLLYLRKGKWKDEQLISREYATMAVTSPVPNSIRRAGKIAADMIPGQRSIGSKRIPDNQCEHAGSYSWLWWTNGIDSEGVRHWPDVPVDTYGCFGHGGLRAMVVLPSLDLIVSWNDTRIEGREMENHTLKLLTDSVTSITSRSGRLVRFFESTDFQQFSPHDELAFAGTQYLPARPGRSYIAYTSKLQGKIGLKNMRAVVYKLLRYDCATGREVAMENVTVADGDQSWDKPGHIGSELAVNIERIGGL